MTATKTPEDYKMEIKEIDPALSKCQSTFQETMVAQNLISQHDLKTSKPAPTVSKQAVYIE